ncbi:MAG: sigma 54-interacting transcriptional regulator [Acidobacteria bacterium]|nr:sigma 54-interacting transcriptional regulator [Acidobacteriota bacterium]
MATRSIKKKGLIRTAERKAAPAKLRPIDNAELKKIFSQVGQKLREGYSSEAQRVLTNTIANYAHSDDDLAGLNRLLSFTLETLGKYKESLEAIEYYEQPENLEKLSLENQVRVTTQLAVAYNNLGDHPKAVTLLKDNLIKARDNDLRHLLGAIDIGLARVYRKLNESSICRDYAQRALNPLREAGDWLGMAEAYREIAISHHQEGDSERSIQYFELGVQIIGERSAPFMLGKLYTDMSGAYWFLRRSQEGIACLEKSIEFFDRTEHILNSVIAYNNLGINLLHMGEWTRAESMISRALDLAVSMDHAHIAGIMDSLGEIKILQGDLPKAREFLEKAVSFAREKGREWYEAQAMRNLARCMLAEGDPQAAAAKAIETIELSERIGDKHHANMVGLVLAESSLKMGDAAACENALKDIEDNDPSSDFFVLGNIQRIRGLAALENSESELAIHHFNRSLTIFEAAEDMYHTGLSHLLLGEHISTERRDQAVGHLTTAAEIFRKLGIRSLTERAESLRQEIGNGTSTPKLQAVATAKASTAVSQLLMVRLAEATASRELLFREVVAVLQQESQARKIMIVEYDANKRLVPFIAHGVSADDSARLAQLFDEAVRAGEEKDFLRKNKIAVFNLRSLNAPPAFVMVSPASSAHLNDGGALDPLFRVVELGLDVISLREKDRSMPNDQQISPNTSANLMPGFIHSSPAMTALVEEVYKIRSSDVTVLVTGESGTGKELVSRAIHALSNRKDKVFVPFNCTAVPKELAEGHLFGFKKGAFTGAVSDSPGMIRSADGGTLFLDEVGDLPLDVQPKLLRFLQEGEIQPIGEKKPIKVDVRVIAATNMPLEDKVAEGTFREDLFYRLNVIRLRVPPLRERRSEIPPIVNYYINHYSSRFGKRDITFTPQTIDLLMVCEWEGNVRQLCNEVQRLIARAVDGEVITPDHLSPELKRSATPLTPAEGGSQQRTITSFDGPVRPFANIGEGGTLEDAVTELEMQMIKNALSRHNWNISRVANELGLTRRGLYLKLTRYGIDKAA